MRLAALFCLAASLASAQEEGRFDRIVSRTDQGRTTRGLLAGGFAFFEAFPAGGAGTFGPCSTTAPTGAKGEALTFARASTATCTKTASGGLATTGIANGDLVTLSTNQPRVEYDSNGVLGLLVESSRANTTLQSQSIDAAPWANSNNIAPMAATLNGADAVVAPDGTTTADDYTFQGVAGTADYGYRYQPAGCTVSATNSGSVFIKSISGGTTVDLTISTAAAAWTSASCTISTTSWTRCTIPNIAVGVGGGAFYVGVGQVGVVTTRSATRVALWGAQCEVGAYATSYIPTTTVAVTRPDESAALALSTSLVIDNGLSWAASATTPYGFAGALAGATMGSGVGRPQMFRASSTQMRCDMVQAPGPSLTATIGSWTTGTTRTACSFSGIGASSTTSGYYNGSLVGTSVGASTTTATINSVFPGALGSTATTFILDGISSRLCVDPDPSRCR